MPDISITINDSQRFAVRLTLDMYDYFQACKQLQNCRTALHKLYHTTDACDALKVEVDNAQLEMLQALKKFKQTRASFASTFDGFSGALVWLQIKKIFAAQCRIDCSQERLLYNSLISDGAALPLVIECLNQCFIELVKNSVDALLEQYLVNSSDNTMLDMEVKLNLTGDNLDLMISDNAGGFPVSYLKNFKSYIESAAYRLQSNAGKKKFSNEYYLGGAGRGLPILLTLLLNGEILDAPGKSRPLYEMSLARTAIHIQNIRKGAEITLTAPLQPYKIITMRSSDQAESALTDKGRANSPALILLLLGEAPESTNSDAVVPKIKRAEKRVFSEMSMLPHSEMSVVPRRKKLVIMVESIKSEDVEAEVYTDGWRL